jgi:hypothetical protein
MSKNGAFVIFRRLLFCLKRTSFVAVCAVSMQINSPEEHGPQLATPALERVRRQGDKLTST